MKKILTLLFVLVASALISQNFSHDPKVISILPTESKTKEIKIKNESKFAEVFVVWCHDNTQKYWTRVGTVSVFQMTEGKFFVKDGLSYGYNLEDRRPIPIGSSKEWRVRNKDIEE
jgi:hypothetical protein